MASVIEMEIGSDHPLHADVDGIIETCRRGGEMTRNLLGFSRKGKYLRRRLSLNSTVGGVCEILAHTIPKNIHVVEDLATDLDAIEGDPSQLEHVLLNLCINAADAMPAGGELVIETRNVRLESSDLQSAPGLEPGAYVRLVLTDTGVGMPQDVLDKCFEPFFTTKPPGAGSGLGLAMVYGTIRNHGGRVMIESRQGTGTVVTINIQAHQPREPHADAPAEGHKNGDLAGVTVLFVDDEELLRRAASRLLTRLGCRVLPAENGREALDVYSQQTDAIDLAILDLNMPVMDGIEAFRRLRFLNPVLPILVATGYGEDEDRIRSLLNEDHSGIIAKPHGVAELSHAILGLLAKS